MTASISWAAAVRADIALLRAENIRPLALILRLEDILSGYDSPDEWYEFRAPSRGKSNCRNENTSKAHVIALEFRDRKAAAALYDQLKGLTERFQAIGSIYMRDFSKTNAAINLYIPFTLGAEADLAAPNEA